MSDRSQSRRVGWGVLRWLVPLGLIGGLLSRLDWMAIAPLLDQVHREYLMLSVLAFLLSQGMIAVRWWYLLRVQDISFGLGRLIWLVLIGAFASNFLPTIIGGDVIKMAVAAYGQPRRAVIVASVIADRLFNLFSMVFWLPCAATLSNLFSLFFGTGLMASAAPSGGSVWRAWRTGIDLAVRAGRAWFTSPKIVLTAVALSWLSIGLSFFSFWMVTEALDLPLSFWQASGIAVLAYFAALVPISINGLGLLEGSLTVLLTAQGASWEQGAIAALLMRLVIVTVSLLGGVRLLGWRDLFQQARRFQEERLAESNLPSDLL